MFKQKNNYYSKALNNLEIKIIANAFIYNSLSIDAIKQLEDISNLPNVYKQIIGLPDLHPGYGVPIGSAFASPLEGGIISSEAVGYDINCGIRLIKTNLEENDLSKSFLEKLSKEYKKLPLGLSSDGIKLSKEEFFDILKNGINAKKVSKVIDKKDNLFIENFGFLEGADYSNLSKEAIKLGIKQVGTLGQGNHFIDLVIVNEIFDKKIAKLFNLKKNQVCVMIHSGSRGFGYKIASEYNKLFTNKNPIAYEYFASNIGQKYYQAMLCASNFAFVNRSVLDYRFRDFLSNLF
ncbi:MAG: RtcB family protein, partial [archaeon]